MSNDINKAIIRGCNILNEFLFDMDIYPDFTQPDNRYVVANMLKGLVPDCVCVTYCDEDNYGEEKSTVRYTYRFEYIENHRLVHIKNGIVPHKSR